MPTDHACRAATEHAALSLERVRPLLYGGQPRPGAMDDPVGRPAGAAVLLAFLDGLLADLSGTLSNWHAGLGQRIGGALGVLAGTDGHGLPQGGRYAQGSVQGRAQDVLTVLADPSRLGPARAGDLSDRLRLVEDAFAGALRRMAVPPEESVVCAAELAVAAGSLFGIHRSPAPPRQPAPAEPSGHASAGTSVPAQLPDWMGGLP